MSLDQRPAVTGRFLAIQDKYGDLQGEGPYTVSHPHEIKLWRLDQRAQLNLYLRTINYGDKGYHIVAVVIETDLDM